MANEGCKQPKIVPIPRTATVPSWMGRYRRPVPTTRHAASVRTADTPPSGASQHATSDTTLHVTMALIAWMPSR